MISSPDCEINMTTPNILALTPEQLEVSPGAGAFTIFFVLAIAVVLLVFNMSKHLRTVDRYRIEEEMRAELKAERAAQELERGDASDPDPPSGEPGDDEPGDGGPGDPGGREPGDSKPGGA